MIRQACKSTGVTGCVIFKIAAIPGDGIGQDVIAAGVRVLEALAKRDRSFAVSFDHFDWGSDRYKAVGSFMPKMAPPNYKIMMRFTLGPLAHQIFLII